MVIEQNRWKLDLSLEGGRIVSLQKDGKYILNTFDRGNGKVGITHLCVPNFGNEFPEYELPAHGPSRDKSWKLKSIDIGKSVEIIYQMIDEGKYPTNLEISQYFGLDDEFVHKIKIENIGKKKARVNLAVHYYFNLNPKKIMLNGEEVDDLVMNNQEMGVRGVNTISDGRGLIIMNLTNFSDRVHLWSGSDDSTCVEPVMGERNINPGQIISREIRLQTK